MKKVKNIVGIKEASGNISQVAKIMNLTDGKMDLYSGNDDQIVPVMSLGGLGVISVLSNVAPQYTHDICAKYLAGDVKGSLEMQLKAIPLVDQLFCEVNPIPVKTGKRYRIKANVKTYERPSRLFITFLDKNFKRINVLRTKVDLWKNKEGVFMSNLEENTLN